MTHSLSVFLRFLYRDTYVSRKSILGSFINFGLIYPAMYAFCFAYLQPNVLLRSGDAQTGTILFVGNILLLLLIVASKQSAMLLFDLDGDRFIDYQISLLNPRLILLERIVFTTLFAFVVTLPFYPLAKLMLQDKLDTSAVAWPTLGIILLLGALVCATYNMFVTCLIKDAGQITKVWSRFNITLIVFGGFWAPWHVVNHYSKLLGYLCLLNPFLYMTEGIRSAFLGKPEFFPTSLCIGVMLLFSVAFTASAWYFFKRKVDHI